jgi:hypothetical protein
VLAGLWLGGAAALATGVAAPLSGWYAMRFQERYEHLFDEAVAYTRVKLRRKSVAELRAEREALRTEVTELAARDQKED